MEEELSQLLVELRLPHPIILHLFTSILLVLLSLIIRIQDGLRYKLLSLMHQLLFITLQTIQHLQETNLEAKSRLNLIKSLLLMIFKFQEVDYFRVTIFVNFSFMNIFHIQTILFWTILIIQPDFSLVWRTYKEEEILTGWEHYTLVWVLTTLLWIKWRDLLTLISKLFCSFKLTR